MKATSEKVDSLLTHGPSWAHRGGGSAIAGTVQPVESDDAVLSSVSSLNERVDDLRHVFNDKTNGVRRADEADVVVHCEGT